MALFGSCQYHDADSFNKAVTQIGRHFSAIHLNVRSIKNKVSDLSMFLDSLVIKFDVLLLSET